MEKNVPRKKELPDSAVLSGPLLESAHLIYRPTRSAAYIVVFRAAVEMFRVVIKFSLHLGGSLTLLLGLGQTLLSGVIWRY